MALRSAARAAAVRVTVGGLLKAAVSGRASTNMVRPRRGELGVLGEARRWRRGEHAKRQASESSRNSAVLASLLAHHDVRRASAGGNN